MSKELFKPKFLVGVPLVIITGLSGAGKSTAMRCFDDLGCYCIDNLPPGLIPTFFGLYQKSYAEGPGVVIASDVRSGSLFGDFTQTVEKLKSSGVKFEILYLDCDTDKLINRYKEARRTHPLHEGKTIASAIEEERHKLEPIREIATRIIDTSEKTANDLREAILRAYFGEDTLGAMRIEFASFGFKYGIPLDADFLFDARFLPNPFYVPELAPLTGEDDSVYDFVMESDIADAYFEEIVKLISLTLENFITVGKYNLVVCIGCTGGRHRSVAFAKRLARHFESEGHAALAVHRDIEK